MANEVPVIPEHAWQHVKPHLLKPPLAGGNPKVGERGHVLHVHDVSPGVQHISPTLLT